MTAYALLVALVALIVALWALALIHAVELKVEKHEDAVEAFRLETMSELVQQDVRRVVRPVFPPLRHPPKCH